MRLKPLGVLVIFTVLASMLVPLVLGGLERSGAIRMQGPSEVTPIDVMGWVALALIAVMALVRPSGRYRNR